VWVGHKVRPYAEGCGALHAEFGPALAALRTAMLMAEGSLRMTGVLGAGWFVIGAAHLAASARDVGGGTGRH